MDQLRPSLLPGDTSFAGFKRGGGVGYLSVATCFIAVYTYAVPTPTPAVNEPIRKQSCGNYTETVPLLGTALATLSPTSPTCDFLGMGRGVISNFQPPSFLTNFRDSAFFPVGKKKKKEINRRISNIFYFFLVLFLYIYIVGC